MAYNSTERRRLLASIVAIFVLGLAAPALAETTTLVCEPDVSGQPWILGVDYSASTVAISSEVYNATLPATITAENIKFTHKVAPLAKPALGGTVGYLIEGRISRLAGALDVSRCSMTYDQPVVLSGNCYPTHARCRAATEKF
jgi:hypothetical protein